MNCRAIFEAKDGAVWIGEAAGLYRWTPGETGAYTNTDLDWAHAFCDGGNGRVWIGTLNHGLWYLGRHFASLTARRA